MNPGEDVLTEIKRSQDEFRCKVRLEALEALYSIIDEELEWHGRDDTASCPQIVDIISGAARLVRKIAGDARTYEDGQSQS
jgi:hypothetical protein